MKDMATATLTAFRNEALADFSLPDNRRAMQDALAKVRSEFGREYKLRLAGESVATGDLLNSLNPSNPSQTIGIHHRATAALANRAVEIALAYFPEWSRTPPRERARMTCEAARQLRLRRFEFDAWLCYEAGKTWIEAEAEIAEAIDFCHYYALEMERLDGPQAVVQLPGEHDEMIYIPLGVGVVIPPWNFPLASFRTIVNESSPTRTPSTARPSFSTARNIKY